MEVHFLFPAVGLLIFSTEYTQLYRINITKGGKNVED